MHKVCTLQNKVFLLQNQQLTAKIPVESFFRIAPVSFELDMCAQMSIMTTEHRQTAFHGKPLLEEDWYFFNTSRLTKGDLVHMCFWEYARECQPLIDSIGFLKAMVGQFLGITDEVQIAKETFDRVTKKNAFRTKKGKFWRNGTRL